MNLRLLKFYGKVSYGLYIYHNLLRDVLKKLLYTPIDHFLGNPLLAGAIYFPLALICCTLIAVLSFNFYEKPFLKLKHKFEDSPRTLHV